MPADRFAGALQDLNSRKHRRRCRRPPAVCAPLLAHHAVQEAERTRDVGDCCAAARTLL